MESGEESGRKVSFRDALADLQNTDLGSEQAIPLMPSFLTMFLFTPFIDLRLINYIVTTSLPSLVYLVQRLGRW